MDHPNSSHRFNTLICLMLLGIGMLFFVELYLVSYIGGDIERYCYWWLQLIRKHLSIEWTLPYFTPGRCAGFLLAADPQVYIYSIHTFISFIIPNVVWTVKIANCLVSFIFAVGMFYWMRCFGVEKSIPRIFAAILTTISGYWVFKLTNDGGFMHVACIAYIPWAMYFIEKLLADDIKTRPQLLENILGLTLSFFLMINSGYFWLQSFPFLFGIRMVIEWVSLWKTPSQLLQKTVWIGIALGFGILLCLSRIGAIYEFQLLKFARYGGAINHMGVCGDTLYLLKTYWRSFFDFKIPHEGLSISFLGGFWECSNYIGLCALIPIIIGLRRLPLIKTSRPLQALLIASLFQFLMTRTTHLPDLVRQLLPVYSQITHHFRGSVTVVFLLIVFLTLGYDHIFNTKNKILIGFAVLLMFFNLTEIAIAYYPRLQFKASPSLTMIAMNDNPPPAVMNYQYAPCELCHLFGYGYWEKIPEPLSFKVHSSVFQAEDSRFFNMHDIRALAAPSANHSYYMTHSWPLWPRNDENQLKQFIHYRQVIQRPVYLKIMEWINLVAVGIFVIGLLYWLKLRIKGN